MTDPELTTLKRLDHVNVRTANLEAMTRWYEDMLGMTNGWRPPFPFPGAWLYAGDDAALHLIAVDGPTGAPENLALEHFAFAATGLKALVAKAEAAGTRCELRAVPGTSIVQANLWDPDGNHIHVDFDAAEAEGLDLG